MRTIRASGWDTASVTAVPGLIIYTGYAMEVLPYNWILAIHIGSFIVTIVTVVIADLHALVWWRGWFAVLDKRRLQWFHRIVSIGLGVSILSGIFLFWPAREYLLTRPSFYTKILFVAVLCVNAIYIHQHLLVACRQRFSELTKAQQRPLLVSGMVSTVGWITVFIMARQLGL